MLSLALRPMTSAEFDAWQDHLARAYADDQVAAGAWPPDEALARARASTAELLPEGLDTPRTLLLVGVLPGSSPVGRVWIALDHPRGVPDCAWLFDIEVDPAHRGRGLGRALLDAAEQAVRAQGIGELQLNVFGDNARGAALYASAGYSVVTQQMRKRLAP